MKYGKWGVLVSFVLVLAGCGTIPRTGDLLVTSAKNGDVFSDKESFEVHKPLYQVARVLKRQSHKCLARDISFTAHGDSNGGVTLNRRETRELTPKMKIGRHHARLTVQVKSIGGAKDLADPPPDGWYMVVVDATAEGAHKTRVDAYYRQTSFKGAFTAIKPWVTGTNMGCPDLTQ